MTPRWTSRTFAALAALALAAALLVGGAPSAAAETPAPADAELEFLQLLNAARGTAGLAPLKSDALIVPIAREWSGVMAASSTLSHRQDLAAQVDARVTTEWQRIGENVGRGGSVPSLHNALMNSPVHLGNILGDYNRVGIGVVNSDGSIWVTFNFMKGPDIDGPTGADIGPVYQQVQTRGIDVACPSGSTPTPTFQDLTTTVHAASIGCVAWWGVANGRTADLFDPTGQVTRGQLASFVARMIEATGVALPVSPPDAFGDDDRSVHELRINQLADLGVVSGKAPGTYSPDDLVSRAAMATFLVRAHDVIAARTLPGGPDSFGDDDGSIHEASIDKVAAAGLAGGTGAGAFGPGAPVQRGQMATFLARTIDLLVDNGDARPR